MTEKQTTNFIDWFKAIILAFENFFHQIQLWFDDEISQQDWFKNITTKEDAEEEE